MKRILVFQHVAYEILGTLHPIIKKKGIRIRYVNFGRTPEMKVDTKEYEGLVILGGPMSVWEEDKHPHLGHETECIQEMIRDKKPVLGICLGAQLIAKSLGAEVKRAKEKEIGWYDLNLTEDGKKDPVLCEFSEKQKVFQWHQDAFELPSGGTWLAKSKACTYQAFRVGTNVYGFQFHLEVDQPMIERWLGLPDHCACLESSYIDKIRNDTFLNIEKNIQMSEKIFGKYIDLFSTKKKIGVLKT